MSKPNKTETKWKIAKKGEKVLRQIVVNVLHFLSLYDIFYIEFLGKIEFEKKFYFPR